MSTIALPTPNIRKNSRRLAAVSGRSTTNVSLGEWRDSDIWLLHRQHGEEIATLALAASARVLRARLGRAREEPVTWITRDCTCNREVICFAGERLCFVLFAREQSRLGRDNRNSLKGAHRAFAKRTVIKPARVSVLQQLRHRVALDLQSGKLEHGDRLPSVREVSDELGSDPRTVLAAYQQLVEEGLVEIRSRSGVFATGAFTITGSALGVPRRWLLETLIGAIERDIPAGRLAEQLRSVLVSKRARVGLLECNEDQLVSMREELTEYFGLDVIALPLEAVASDVMPRELYEVDFLVSAGHGDIIARVAANVCKPYVITQVRPALLNRLSRLLNRGAVYFLIADSRFGVKMRRLVAPMPCSENLHVLVVGEDDLRVIPEGVPTYAMRSVQPSLAQMQHRGREISPQRIFAEETIREILSHLLDLSHRAGDRGPD